MTLMRKIARGMVSAVTVARHMRKAAAATAAAVRECSAGDSVCKREERRVANCPIYQFG